MENFTRDKKRSIVPSNNSARGDVCMKGSITYQKDRNRWAINWYDTAKKHNKTITRYKKNLIPCTAYKMRQDGQFILNKKGFPIPDKKRCAGYKIAKKLLAQIQGDYEHCKTTNRVFKIEKYLGTKRTNVTKYFEDWLKIKASRKPGTIKAYKSYYRNWIKPFFEKNRYQLHEIQLDTLHKLLLYVKLSPKGQYNVLNCFHCFMDHMHRSKRIPEMPAFPKKSDYGMVEPEIEWLPESLQKQVLEAVPEEHRPIFLFLKMHYRRPSEACALKWGDYDEINQVFVIQRSVSAREIVGSTKTGAVHYVPCDPEFIPIIKELKKTVQWSPNTFVFRNPRATKKGKRYTNESLNSVWRNACNEVGIKIKMYSGLKHSSCSQFVNEKGGTIDELQMLTDHKRRESVLRYTKVGVERKRELMKKRRIIRIDAYKTQTKNKSCEINK